ncbi:SAM-dependent methyltransferase [Crenobacter caeni]|uniref:Class I SAM-dependent methyltransferase n=1 Tax=Crenobacter caeni TaxID=2705474 RepID=A0A6B2KMJ8_9NEIS|nr:cyclopropane-fatty-acyl-phospholipid synthase family protein [Crenobacter caeni]NDV11432.1 class I SAM-dependent methyltransferase [Crenobacter caeni]
MLKTLLRSLFAGLNGPRPFAVEYWDGDRILYGQGEPAFTLRFTREPDGAPDEPVVYLGECYMDGALEIDGSWDALLATMVAGSATLIGRGTGKALGWLGEKLAARRERQSHNVRHHYDIGNDFYRLWLDETLTYSCAYFRTPDDTLEAAQRNKVALCLDKLGVGEGTRLLDIGCGWGEMAIAAARRGARVVGITLSQEQRAGACERVRAAGLEGRVDIRLQDYLDLDGNVERFDRVVSVGMFEHVGRGHHHDFFARASDVLEEGGLMLLHTITGPESRETNPWIEKYIFPGGYIPAPETLVSALPAHRFQLVHMESLRLHYAQTLQCWLKRYKAVTPQVLAMFDTRFERMWTMYLRGCSAAFRAGDLDIHQLLVSKGNNNTLPRDWGYLYGGGAPLDWAGAADSPG